MKALLVTGEGGIGKSWTLDQVLAKMELAEDEDYVVIKGSCTPRSLFNLLRDYSDKLVIFDDCDPVLTDRVSGQILKSTLDAFSRRRTVSWLTSTTGKTARFDFEGQVIFLSNMDRSNIEQALLSRCVTVDLYMTQTEKIERMGHILPYIAMYLF